MSKNIHPIAPNTFDEYLNDEERVNPEDREAILLEADLISKLVETRKKDEE